MKTTAWWVLAASATVAIACSKAAKGAGGGTTGGGAAAAAEQAGPPDPNDPCNAVTQAEAEHHLGPLAHPPFRSTDAGVPDPKGQSCKYLGGDGHYVLLEVERTDGKMEMTALGMVGGLVGKIFTEDNGKTDTLEGNWDDAKWMGPGHFFALKGPALVTVDVSGGKGGIAAAADLASKGLGRIEKPLAYNGGGAAAGAPAPRETGDACGLLSASDIETVVGGPLEGPPSPGGRGANTSCVFHVKGKGDLKLDVGWNHGFEHFAEGKQVMGVVMGQSAGMKESKGSNDAPPTAGAPPATKPADDPGLGKMMGVLQKLAKTQGLQLDKSGSLVHDTLVTGPWDEGMIEAGGALVAVKHDVIVTIDFRIVDPEQAKALMAKVMEKL